MKKILAFITTITIFFCLIPNSYAYEQGSVTCIYNSGLKYSSGGDSWNNYLEVNFYGIGTMYPSVGEIIYYSIYNNDLNDKREIFAYREYNSIDYFVNYQIPISGIETQYIYEPSIILSSFSQGTTAITENNKELVCPKQMFILEKTIETGKYNPFVANKIETSYDLYACGNNYGDYNNDTCPVTTTYLREYRKTANHDGSAAKLYTMDYYTGNLISNVGQDRPTDTNVQEQYNENQQNIEKYCDENSETYNAEECQKAEIAQGTHIQQTETNMGITESQLKEEYLKFKSHIDLDFDTQAGCESYLGNPRDKVNKPPAYYLQFAFNSMKYIAIILLLVLTVMEFAKAVTSSNQDAIKKALLNTVKRALIAVVIFLLPILIEFLFKILGLYSSTTCGIK